jgi:hypothetical protein
MVALVMQLLALKGRRALVEFTNGDRVECQLVDVDPDAHEEITFDVVRVIRATRTPPYSSEATYVAPIDTVRRVEPLDEQGSVSL